MMGNHSSWAGTADLNLGLGSFTLRRTTVSQLLFALGLCLYLSTAVVNIGIIALDDYEFGIARAIPAQTSSYSYIIDHRDIRTPVPPLILASMGKLALKLGLTDPVAQLRFILFILGSICFSIQAYFVPRFFSLSSVGSEQSVDYRREIALFLIGCYFLCPFLYTRPLVENLSAPFLTASAFFACLYFPRSDRRYLTYAILALMVSAILRFQAGVSFIGLVGLVALKREKKDWLVLAGVGLVAFLFSGWLDWYITGHFHGSLVSYVVYNVKYSSIYGVQPFYIFTLLFLAITIPPTLISKYKGFDWKTEYRYLIPVLAYFISFLVAHSLVPHKEERFMVPALGIFLVLLTPLFNYFLVRGWNQWRVYYFLGVNFLLLPFASYNIAQNNTIALIRFLTEHPEIKIIAGVDETLVLYPKAFSLHVASNIKISTEDVSQLRGGDCETVIAVRQEMVDTLPSIEDFYHKVAEFKPGILEHILVKLNPKRNVRRGAIALYADKGCSY